MDRLSRRGLFTVLAGAGLGVAASARPASAFTEVKDDAYLAHLRDSACGGQAAAHREFLAKAELMLGEKLDPEQKRELLAKLTCPICGCSLSTASF